MMNPKRLGSKICRSPMGKASGPTASCPSRTVLPWKIREITCGDDWEEGLHSEEIAQLKAQQFAGKSFDFGVLASRQEILLVVDQHKIRSGWGLLAQKLGAIGLAIDPNIEGFIERAVGFSAGVRQFGDANPYLVASSEPSPEQKSMLQAFLSGIKLIEAPTSLLGVEALMCAGRHLGDLHGASVEIHAVDEIPHQFPAIHAVGRTAKEPPRLLHLAWGAQKNPRLCLVGKGVVFDSGGLNLKPGNSMALMRKDMGGAAFVLALASAIMAKNLPVRLEVYVPAVENAIGPGALRPGDIMATHQQ
jgi:Leucyl aminopeptidase